MATKKKRAKWGSYPDPVSHNAIPNNIRNVRRSKYITQADLAERLGISASVLLYWEIRRNAIPDPYKIKLCKELKCKIDELFDWSGDDK